MKKQIKLIFIAAYAILMIMNLMIIPRNVNAETNTTASYLKIEGVTQLLNPKNLNLPLFNIPETYYVKLTQKQTGINYYTVTYQTPTQEITGCISKTAVITETNSPISPVYLNLQTTFLSETSGYEYPTLQALEPAITFSEGQTVYFIGSSEGQLSCVEYENRLYYVQSEFLSTTTYPRLKEPGEPVPSKTTDKNFQLILVILITIPSVILIITLFSSKFKRNKHNY